MFSSSGILRFDPKKNTKHFTPWWCLLECDENIAEYYAWLLKKYGLESNSKSLWGTHISVIKGEDIPDPSTWGNLEGMEVDFNYNNFVRFENGKHAWVDVYSEDLSAVREMLGLPFKPWYHLTIGRLERPYEI
jgi:hypothetical protein